MSGYLVLSLPRCLIERCTGVRGRIIKFSEVIAHSHATYHPLYLFYAIIITKIGDKVFNRIIRSTRCANFRTMKLSEEDPRGIYQDDTKTPPGILERREHKLYTHGNLFRTSLRLENWTSQFSSAFSSLFVSLVHRRSWWSSGALELFLLPSSGQLKTNIYTRSR